MIDILKYINLTSTFHYRKCDLPACTKVNPLWNVFRGCGHSFHIECILPYISDCRVCEATLQANVEALGTTANNAVFAPATRFEDDDQSDEEGERTDETDESDNGNDDEEPEDEQNETIVNDLIQKIGLWRRSPLM